MSSNISIIHLVRSNLASLKAQANSFLEFTYVNDINQLPYSVDK